MVRLRNSERNERAAKKNVMCNSFLSPFEVSVMSSELAVREALEKFLTKLQPLQLDSEETGTIELVLAEVLNNIVEHAYPAQEQNGKISIKCNHRPDGLLLKICDYGVAMPDGHLPLGSLASNEVELEDLPEGGFGWFLIQHLAKDVTYQRVENENHLQMRLAIGLSA